MNLSEKINKKVKSFELELFSSGIDPFQIKPAKENVDAMIYLNQDYTISIIVSDDQYVLVIYNPEDFSREFTSFKTIVDLKNVLTKYNLECVFNLYNHV